MLQKRRSLRFVELIHQLIEAVGVGQAGHAKEDAVNFAEQWRKLE